MIRTGNPYFLNPSTIPYQMFHSAEMQEEIFSWDNRGKIALNVSKPTNTYKKVSVIFIFFKGTLTRKNGVKQAYGGIL
jgi:hypothetical protein